MTYQRINTFNQFSMRLLWQTVLHGNNEWNSLNEIHSGCLSIKIYVCFGVPSDTITDTFAQTRWNATAYAQVRCIGCFNWPWYKGRLCDRRRRRLIKKTLNTPSPRFSRCTLTTRKNGLDAEVHHREENMRRDKKKYFQHVYITIKRIFICLCINSP